MRHDEPGSWLSPIPSKRTSKIVTDKITEAIAAGELKPGDYLPTENQLAEALHVGKSSVRESIKMLEAIGVVEILRGNGSRIRSEISADALSPLTYQLLFISNSSQQDLVQFRRVIEAAVTCYAIDTIGPRELDALWEIHRQMERNQAAGINCLDLDVHFHELIYTSTNNPFFACVGTAIMQLFRPSMEVSNAQYPHIVLGNHAQILEAFAARDKQMMEKAISNSINQWDALAFNTEKPAPSRS